MDRVGGFHALKALEQDAQAYDDVLVVLEAEHDAEVTSKLKAQASGGG